MEEVQPKAQSFFIKIMSKCNFRLNKIQGRIIRKASFFVVILCLATSATGLCDSSANSIYQTKIPEAINLRWMSQPIKKSDASNSNQSFLNTRSAVDRKTKSLKPAEMDKVVAAYIESANKHPKSMTAQYEAGYAILRKIEQTNPNSPNALNVLEVVSLADQILGRISTPYLYQYARLRFLLDIKVFTGPLVKTLGRRLVSYKPDDYDILFRLIYFLNTSENLQERKEAIGYAQRLVRLQPQRPDAYVQLGSVYYSIWLFSKTKRDAANALQAFKGYSKVAPASDQFQAKVKSLVIEIQNGPQLDQDQTQKSIKELNAKIDAYTSSPEYQARHRH